METISVKLLTSVRPRGPAAIGLNSQEQLVSDHWFSALNLSEDPAVCTHIAGTRLAPFNLLLLPSCLYAFVSLLSKILSMSPLIDALNEENIRFQHERPRAGGQR